MTHLHHKRITLVTVTYGDRLHYCAELLRRSFEHEGVSHAVVVSNNAIADLSPLEAAWGKRITIVRLATNTGSANGYAVGIGRALERESTDYIWLMDDDNAPCEGALDVLCHQLDLLTRKQGRCGAAVLGFRPDHQGDIAAGVPAGLAMPPRSSYFGFHVGRIPYKIWRRTPWGRPRPDAIPDVVHLPFAPYGGLLGHRDMYADLGLPVPELVLYADDIEYTWRLTARGGCIALVTAARLEDLEGSWNVKRNWKNHFECMLLSGSDFRAYYSSRNQAWFDRNHWSTSGLMYRLNRFVFLRLLRLYGKRRNAGARLRLLERAIADGEASRLGFHADYSL
ncbi:MULTISPECIES: glycosyl transferase family 2 [unclassified Cupriavidus]|jgi:GT2 family glycosyltransferase|uniref:glycosyl transferase family 2 n=1 Tax=unclassified Cupriavidus TaxID=2640874 RepID=UPI001BFFE7AE|nr:MULTISPECIES: glycosyl transferase family 2 [unclassified Cupriavidus]MCA3182004.1 glycosyltransferase family 2 protein [Cupriavidus sp.]MCA3193771.1 glycosyltransferase family 2 protein [Cupriavidus sp.]MCA3196256.1 glycosyltransferase family 2 protein [Cupriavidus sp.]MCA3203777.1 glycosyltransferase family 2 protein [Cupriavidus sp.]MCA3207821.1 glycosyltransferase family 2 protein [Cupriavidus sp.]